MESAFVKVLENFQKRLTNITGANKSLVHLRLSKTQDIDFDQLDYLNNQSSFTLLEKILARQKVKLCPVVDPRDEKSNVASIRLRKIFKKDEFLFEERGAKDLYLGWPYIEGKLNAGNHVRCPLLYFPVELQEKNNNWYLSYRKDVSISFNKTFLLAYSHVNGVNIDEEILNYSFSDFSKEAQEFRKQLYDLLKDSSLDINFNQELFRDEINRFVDYKKLDFSNHHSNGQLKLQSFAVLGIFSQADSYLLPDYDTIIAKPKYESVEEMFGKKSYSEVDTAKFSPDYLNQVKEESLITPLSSDISQENAIKAIKSGSSIVVQGPPGTGKSQLLCNTICDFIARGKKVLVVCQKRAALDVIYKRLREIEVNDFVTLVHDHNADRKGIYSQLSRQIESIDHYQRLNNSLDSIYLEREFLHAARKIDLTVDQLNQFKAALFDDQEYGRSIKYLYLNVLETFNFVEFKFLFKYFDYAHEQRFSDKLRDISVFEKQISQKHKWVKRRNFSEFDLTDKSKLIGYVNEVFTKSNDFTDQVKHLLEQFDSNLDETLVHLYFETCNRF